MKKSNYAVVGRIPFDDDETIFCYYDVTQAEALARFEVDMIELDGRTKAQLEEEYGEGNILYVTAVLQSESPIYVK